MKLLSFQIKNYRSIVDTGWVNTSSDNITSLIGQNESGKTSILEALLFFSTGVLSNDPLRSDGSLPEVACKFDIGKLSLPELFPDKTLPKGLGKTLSSTTVFKRRRLDDGTTRISNLDEQIVKLFAEAEKEPQVEGAAPPLILSDFITTLFPLLPKFELFIDDSNLLPNSIDLEDLQNNKTETEGFMGAVNLLKIAGVDISFLQTGSERLVANKIDALNKSITGDFRDFWTQRIGKSNKISIEFELKNHDSSIPEKSGKHYITFWIKDGAEKLYPKQRSKGVRWFLSFYLNLKAAALNENQTLLLIDEPGGSLHARAQEDVLRVFEEIKRDIQIIYTTHSPYLVNIDKIHRILAIQRADENNDQSASVVLDAHKLGSASIDTLSPIYSSMGVDFCNQQVIKKDRNVLLEEISAFYYLKAFKKLLSNTAEMHFLPATGVTNIPAFANIFLGWGIDYVVVVDDETSGRRVYNELKKTLFNDDEANASSKMLKIKDCLGIEDIFSTVDFKKHVLKDPTNGYSVSNSEYVKGKPKAMLALNFMHSVNDGTLSKADFEPVTLVKINKLIDDITTRL